MLFPSLMRILWGHFWHWESYKNLKTLSFAYSRNLFFDVSTYGKRCFRDSWVSLRTAILIEVFSIVSPQSSIFGTLRLFSEEKLFGKNVCLLLLVGKKLFSSLMRIPSSIFLIFWPKLHIICVQCKVLGSGFQYYRIFLHPQKSLFNKWYQSHVPRVHFFCLERGADLDRSRLVFFLTELLLVCSIYRQFELTSQITLSNQEPDMLRSFEVVLCFNFASTKASLLVVFNLMFSLPITNITSWASSATGTTFDELTKISFCSHFFFFETDKNRTKWIARRTWKSYTFIWQQVWLLFS